MSRTDLDRAVEWAAREGWNPGLHDAECFYPVDPAGFFMAFDNDEPVGSISAVAYDHQFGFIGFFIVTPDHRGHTVGIELGRRALEHLNQHNVGLDGVEKKIRNYESIGFKLAYNNVRYEGRQSDALEPTSAVPLDTLPPRLIQEYDARFFPAPRPAFLAAWISRPGTRGFAMLDGLRLTGYGVIRPCRKGFKLGPLFADNPSTADILLRSLTRTIPTGALFYLDVPAPNSAAVNLAKQYQMQPVFRTARMYSRAAPALPLDGIFGVTSFELG